MRRVFPRSISDKFQLSIILEQYLNVLRESPLQVYLSALAYETRIPEQVFQRLLNLRTDPMDAQNIHAEDFHILFSNLQIRYPTLKIWELENGEVFIEI
jgi:hypothetical protein